MCERARVLVADDDSVTRALLTGALTQWGYQPEVETTGDAALQRLLDSRRPPIAILDWEMPGVTGVEICRRLGEGVQAEARPWVIVLTSREDEADPSLALEAGADDFVRKPVHFAEIRTRLRVAESLHDLKRVSDENARLEGAMAMASTVCHEFNQPLQAARTNLQLLGMGRDPDEEAPEEVTAVEAALARLSSLTHRLMRLTHYEPQAYLNHDTDILELPDLDPVPGGGD